MAKKQIESGTIADAYIEILADRGVDYLFANAGTDFAPLIESLARCELEGRKTPKPITVPHENVAVAMAYGVARPVGQLAARLAKVPDPPFRLHTSFAKPSRQAMRALAHSHIVFGANRKNP